ncbi:hypothetical protein J437_LFUL015383 [Ladona fulva]|uniref:HTH CENPB-type domain-containing protein n=1 Tax=Ladona fulva TaxID=123851 RepID=A0A8K0P7A5_LADFU|nr:hypothetical protein J437_LFUL015383 [Ladona fulva]
MSHAKTCISVYASVEERLAVAAEQSADADECNAATLTDVLGRQFDSIADIKTNCAADLKRIPKAAYQAEFESWKKHWQRVGQIVVMRYRKCFWPELEKTLLEWVISERAKGSKVSTTSLLLKAKGLAEEYKIENFKAYPSWGFQFMKLNNLCIRTTSSVGQKLPQDWEAKVEKFRLYVKENLYSVNPAHFGNMDEVPVSFDLPGSRTVHLKGSKEVSVATTGHEKSNFTVVLTCYLFLI